MNYSRYGLPCIRTNSFKVFQNVPTDTTHMKQGSGQPIANQNDHATRMIGPFAIFLVRRPILCMAFFITVRDQITPHTISIGVKVDFFGFRFHRR